ncbi:MAG: PH domain-containing protein [Butyribacter sp.]|nr:PH domain-containing protein [bacterium]MDY3854258.1 PH domain-containing protein [Butyribacter sp.]
MEKEEKVFQKLSKKARGCMLVNEIILAGICTIILAIVWVKWKDTLAVANWIWAIVAVVWVISLIAPFFRYERYRYCFSNEDIDVIEGFLFVERNIVPIERLHKVAMESGPIDRIFGLAKVLVTTAGGDVTIRFLEKEVAEQIVETLKTRINQYAVMQREG